MKPKRNLGCYDTREYGESVRLYGNIGIDHINTFYRVHVYSISCISSINHVFCSSTLFFILLFYYYIPYSSDVGQVSEIPRIPGFGRGGFRSG